MQRILIVDDEPTNIELVEEFLEGEGYEVFTAASGLEALALATAQPPDLVLLDVMMPGLDGFEVAQRLKALCPAAFLPVVLVTALGDVASKVTGLGGHADEFLTKPVDLRELLVRVRNLLRLRVNDVELRAKNLEHLELHRFKDELSSMIVHDLKSPLTAVIANLNFVLAEPENLDPMQLEALRDAQNSAARTVRLIHNLLDVTRVEAQRLQLRLATTPISSLVEPIVRQHAARALRRTTEVIVRLDPALGVALDADVMTRVLENLFDNAARYTPVGGRIEVGLERVGADAVLSIGNSGPAIEPASRSLIFEKYGQASANSGRMNLGIGLYFCRLAVEAHRGSIWVDSMPGLPTVFKVSLPLT